MTNLIYAALLSLDGYVADPDGNFDWAAPGEGLHAFINDLQRPVGTYLYGRRMYETMVAWETWNQSPGQTPVTLDFARIWQAAEKVVYSRTLDEVSSARTRIEREFDPESIHRMKAQARGDISIAGPNLAATAIRAGVVDEYHFFVAPVIVGAGNPALPNNLRQDLELIDERRFDDGFVYVRYRANS